MSTSRSAVDSGELVRPGARRRWWVCAAAVAAIWALHAQVSAASFDCQRARTAQERFICAHPEVGDLDREMASAYRRHIASLSDAGLRQVLASQRAWLAYWPRACSASTRQVVLEAVGCAIGAYRKRIEQLKPPASGPGLLSYTVSKYRYLAPEAEDAPAGTHEMSWPQFEPSLGAAPPAWLPALNIWLQPSQPELSPAKQAEADEMDAESTTDVSLNVMLITPWLVQAVKTRDFYLHGGAHGLSTLAYSHFLIEQSRPLQPRDVFTREDWRHELAQKVWPLLQRGLGENLMVASVKDVADLIELSSLDFSGPGLRVHFNPYDVAPYSTGPVSVTLAVEDLAGLMAEPARLRLSIAAPRTPVLSVSVPYCGPRTVCILASFATQRPDRARCPWTESLRLARMEVLT